MRDEDLEVLVTLDDPWYGPEEDIFNHLQPVTDWPTSIVHNIDDVRLSNKTQAGPNLSLTLERLRS